MALNNTGKPKGIYKIIYPQDEVKLEFINKTHRGQIIFRDDLWLFEPGIAVNRVNAYGIEEWSPTEVYVAEDSYVSYISPDSENLPEDNPFKYSYIYKCIEDTLAGESPETHPTKWLRQGKSDQVSETTIFISDVLGLEEYLEAIANIDTTYTNTTPTDSTIGGISAGTTFENKTMQEMWDMLLYPELFPTLSNPSATFLSSLSGSSSTAYREVGESITVTYTSTFNRGSISPAYGTSGYRSGELVSHNLTGPGVPAYTQGTTPMSVAVPFVVVLGTTTWEHNVSYAQGEQPLSNKGNAYNSPLPAGNTNTSSKSIIGVYPIFATSASIDVMTKQPLSAHGAAKQTALAAEAGAYKQTVDIPTAWGTVGTLEQYNTLSGSWDEIALSAFTVTDITKNINGNVVNYKRYTHNGPTIGARTLNWKV